MVMKAMEKIRSGRRTRSAKGMGTILNSTVRKSLTKKVTFEHGPTRTKSRSHVPKGTASHTWS